MQHDINNPPVPEVEQEAHPAVPTAGPASTRNKHLKVDDPKCKQFTGRATQSQYDRITEAMELHRVAGQPYDIVKFTLDLLDHVEADIFQTFKTKKKK